MNQKDRMLKGLPYKSWLDGLYEERMAAKELLYDYNHSRPHSARGYLTPAEFAAQRNSGNLTSDSTPACS